MLVGGFKHEIYFPFHIWDVILPIDELHHFSRWAHCTTNQDEMYIKKSTTCANLTGRNDYKAVDLGIPSLQLKAVRGPLILRYF